MYRIRFRLVNGLVNENEARVAIGKLSSSRAVGINEISTVLLKKCPDSLMTPLIHIINLTFETGTFPDASKLAKFSVVVHDKIRSFLTGRKQCV